MAVNENYQEYIKDQLSDFGNFEMKKMFGGIGIFREGLMFGMIGGNTFRLKVDEHNQADFEAQDMKPYMNDKKKKGMPYWEVPASVLEDRQVLKAWAEKAYSASQRTKK